MTTSPLSYLFRDRYLAVTPLPRPQVGDVVAVPVWLNSDVIGYDTGEIVHIEPSVDTFYVVQMHTYTTTAAYFAYSVSAAPVDMGPPADDGDTLGACGCTDYHMADCPLRTGGSDGVDADTILAMDLDAFYDYLDRADF